MVRITVVAVLLGALVLPAVALAVTRYGDRGVNRLNGEAGAERIVEARFGDDHIVGGPGNDLLVARRGNDTVFGGTGNDTIYGGTGLDTVDCGPGRDVLYINVRSDRARSRNCEIIRET
jgi:Ca2+-binding RTX toxin-like protein